MYIHTHIYMYTYIQTWIISPCLVPLVGNGMKGATVAGNTSVMEENSIVRGLP